MSISHSRAEWYNKLFFLSYNCISDWVRALHLFSMHISLSYFLKNFLNCVAYAWRRLHIKFWSFVPHTLKVAFTPHPPTHLKPVFPHLVLPLVPPVIDWQVFWSVQTALYQVYDTCMFCRQDDGRYGFMFPFTPGVFVSSWMHCPSFQSFLNSICLVKLFNFGVLCFSTYGCINKSLTYIRTYLCINISVN